MVRVASLDDAEKILSVINESNREAFRRIIPEEFFRSPVLSIEELLRKFEHMTFYLYEDCGNVVGVAALQVEDLGVGRIAWFYVLPGHQRKGIGTALLTHLERIGQEMCLKKLRLITAEKAYWAMKFYKKHSYSLSKKIERPWGFDIEMKKELI